MIRLFFDTATTGKPLFYAPVTDPGQPHLCRLSYSLVDGNNEVSSWSKLIYPGPDWTVEPGAHQVHRIDLPLMTARGIPLYDAVALFQNALARADRLIAFNFDFHSKVIEKAALDCGFELNIPERCLPVCAMRQSTDIVGKQRMEPGGGYQWPKLPEAIEFCTGNPLPKADRVTPEARGLIVVRGLHAIHNAILYAEKHGKEIVL